MMLVCLSAPSTSPLLLCSYNGGAGEEGAGATGGGCRGGFRGELRASRSSFLTADSMADSLLATCTNPRVEGRYATYEA